MSSILPWIAHAYTATGTVWALLATAMTFAHNFRAAFIFLVVATFVDATDGVLARAFNVKQRTPNFDGALLDNIIDYMTFVFVPALIVWQANLVRVPFPVCAAMLMSSAYGFAHTAAKVEEGDHFFTGFPSYWNIVVVYLYILQLPQISNAIILGVLAVLVFVPIRYVYPSRTRTLQTPTLILGAVWALIFTWMIFRLPDTSGPWTMLSFIFPVWYVALSLWLHGRERRALEI
ncbi:MAG TPA: CDP-alcohol phosphatidyltransferase family protein [Vicinamibacterales bacterium]|nr:CDP-alcohol phosphatidyltransferase family protein [Vicinamibacterales bacterium]